MVALREVGMSSVRSEVNVKPTVPEVLPLVDAYYGFDGCGVGGSLHIVLDDGNLEDEQVQFCIENAIAGHWCTDDKPDEAGELLGRLLLLMSMTQRRKIYRSGTRGTYMERSEFIARCRALLERP